MQNSANARPEGTSCQLSDAQLAQIHKAIESLSSAQIAWASGYLAALSGAPSPAKQTLAAASMTILYATQGGNAKNVATDLATYVNELGYAARVLSADDYRPRDLTKEQLLAVVISTQGDGDMPESAQELVRYLGNGKPSRLSNLRYAVFGLGDSSYEHFCKAGRDLDAMLQENGASSLLQRVDADVDFHDIASGWYTDLAAEVEPILKTDANADQDHPNAQIIQLSRQVPATNAPDRNNPVNAELVDNRSITTSDAHTGVYHLSVAIDPEVISYRPGDAMGVWFRNDPELVDSILHAAGLDAAESVDIKGESLPLGDALAGKLELTQLHPLVVKAWAGLTNNASLNELVQDAKKLRDFSGERQFIDLLLDYPGEVSATELADVLQPLQPRLYSIASSQAAYEDEIHLTVSSTEYHAHGRDHSGAASGFLTRRIEAGDEFPIYIAANPSFGLPEDGDTPLILVGTGSGIAPYRAFLQEREANGSTGPVWLVFGNRNFHRDFLYQTDWIDYRNAGLIQRVSLAFSRDTHAPAYVQDRLREEGAELYRWLEDGARIYVCGGIEMEKGVSEALPGIIATHGGLDTEAAQQYVEDLRAGHRYLRDVY